MSAIVETIRMRSFRARRRRTNSTPAWHERLGAGVRPESEGVGEQYGCRNAERRKYVPAGKEGNWR